MRKRLLAIILFFSNTALAQPDPYSTLYPAYPKVQSVDTIYLNQFQVKKVICYKKGHLEIVFDAEGFEELIASMVTALMELPTDIISNDDERRSYQVGIDSSIAALQRMQEQIRRQAAQDTVQIIHDPLPGFLTLSGAIDHFIMEKMRIGKCCLRSKENKAPAFIVWRYEEFMPGTHGNRCYLPDEKTCFLQYITSQQ